MPNPSPWKTDDTFELLKPLVSEDLVPRDFFSRAAGAIPLIPSGVSGYFLECRLSVEDSRVDFGACYRAPREDPGNGDGPEEPDLEDTWPGVARIFRLWIERESRLYRHVCSLWIEVDEARALPDQGPGMLFCVDPGMSRAASSYPFPSRESLLGIAQEVSESLVGAPLPRSAEKALLACMEGLPAQGRIHHISVMPSRSPSAIKLNLSLPKADLAAYLSAIGWPGSNADLLPVWEELHPLMNFAKLDLHIGDGLASGIGLELVYYNSRLSGRKRALAKLEALGIGAGRKCRALADWSGQPERTYPGHKWPTRLVEVLGLKVVLSPSSDWEAKGYMGTFPECALVPPAGE